jgi:hypothetical protein
MGWRDQIPQICIYVFRDSLSEVGREEDGYREDLCSIKSDSDTIRAESPDSSRGDSNSEYLTPNLPTLFTATIAEYGGLFYREEDHAHVFFRQDRREGRTEKRLWGG